mgnify:CR=1 FL=1
MRGLHGQIDNMKAIKKAIKTRMLYTMLQRCHGMFNILCTLTKSALRANC